MATLYIVVSPNGNIAYAGPNEETAKRYKPQEVPGTDGGPYVVFGSYELYVIHGVQTPWIDNREENRRLREEQEK